MDFKEPHHSNAPVPIQVTLLEISKDFKELQVPYLLFTDYQYYTL